MLEWVFRRCDGAVEAADTPIGRVPTPGGLEHRRALDRRARTWPSCSRSTRRVAVRDRPDPRVLRQVRREAAAASCGRSSTRSRSDWIALAPDVAVVGGGIVGLAAADALARRGADVVVLERGIPGAGQSAGIARGFRHLHATHEQIAAAVRARRRLGRLVRAGRRAVAGGGGGAAARRRRRGRRRAATRGGRRRVGDRGRRRAPPGAGAGRWTAALGPARRRDPRAAGDRLALPRARRARTACRGRSGRPGAAGPRASERRGRPPRPGRPGRAGRRRGPRATLSAAPSPFRRVVHLRISFLHVRRAAGRARPGPIASGRFGAQTYGVGGRTRALRARAGRARRPALVRRPGIRRDPARRRPLRRPRTAAGLCRDGRSRALASRSTTSSGC